MGDAENALPPTKKRVAGRELSRDNPGLDDDEESAEQETGTFKRASEEVLATRRIVKVRRNQPPSTIGSPPSSNPFANIQLVPPIHSATNKPTSKESEKTTEKATGKEGDIKETNGPEMPKEPETETSDVKNDSVDEASRSTEENERKTYAGEEETENISKTQANELSESDKKSEEAGGEESKNESNASLSSFQQLSSSKNAFTGLAGTGFSSTSFSFGSFGKDGSGFGSGSGTVFGLKSENSSFPSFSFGSPNNGSSTKSEVSGVPSMQEVTVETGEENEKAIFTGDAVLFEYLDGGWKERGKGEVKVNATTEGPERARLVMRARGNYRLILNASLYPDMKLTSMDKRGITFACANSASEGKEGLLTFALKFKDASVVDEFRGAVTAHKGGKNAVLKTPENSPKASDE